MFKQVAVAGAIVLMAVGLAQEGKVFGARSVAISRDGSKLAFSYLGDVWVVPSTGGKAVPLTQHIEMDDNPVWSPDGKTIAFASNRYGNNDIFVVPSDGGSVKRLTWHSGPDVPSDWSPDGKQILFRAVRDDANNGIYSVDVATGKTHQYFLDMMTVGSPHFTSDGNGIIYTRFGFPMTRPRYEGSAASQLWLFDIRTGKRKLIRNSGFQNLWPSVGANNKLFVSTVVEKTPNSHYLNGPLVKSTDNTSRTPNLYSIGMDGAAKRLTNFVGKQVRYVSAATKTGEVAFEDEGEVYILKGDTPTRVDITATVDDKTTNEERLVLTGEANQVAMSPKGDRLAFVVRGEIWMVPTKKGKGPNADDATQLTNYPGLDENPLWDPDGKHLFFTSDRNGSESIFKMDVDTLQTTQVTPDPFDCLKLRITPDGKSVSYFMAGPKGGLYTVSITGGSAKRVFEMTGSLQYGPEHSYDWSPDGRYVAYVRQQEHATDVFVYDTTTRKDYNVTKLNVDNAQPKFSTDGRFLYVRSSRDPGGLFLVPLHAEDARDTELELKYEKPKSAVKVEIDFEGISGRIRKFIPLGPEHSLTFDATNGDVLFANAGDIWKVAYDGSNLQRITNGAGIGEFVFSGDGNSLVFTRNGILQTLNLRAQNWPVATVAFREDWTRDIRLERRAAFNEIWRLYNRGFYDPNFHGRDFAAIKSRYERFLGSIGHREEFATLLNMMIGELESSHSEVRAAPGNPASAATAHLGFTFDYSFDGPGIKIKDVPAHTPGSFAKTKVGTGEIVTKINGKDVSVNEGLYRDVLNNQIGRDLTLTVQNLFGKTREVKYRALNPGEWSGLLYNNRIEARRKLVEEKSGGKLTYVHIAGMGGGNFTTFNQEIWEYVQGKQGVIIDVRNNGGGNISDRLINILEQVPHSYYQERDRKATMAPGESWNMPTVVMHAETSFSNAEMFPYAMHQRGLATLVGMPTPGYVIWTYGLRLIDGTSARMPTSGVYRLDGSPLENMGQQPDYKVDISPEDYLSGKDPQLDKAIEVLMKKMK